MYVRYWCGRVQYNPERGVHVEKIAAMTIEDVQSVLKDVEAWYVVQGSGMMVNLKQCGS